MKILVPIFSVVVPGYYLVWYNTSDALTGSESVVVPGYYLVWYNDRTIVPIAEMVVVPGYYLVWYNYNFLDMKLTPL